MASGGDDGHLVELSVEECWDLVRAEPVGRLAWNGADGPTVLPINFAVTQGGIEVRTTAYSSIAQLHDASVVTFQVDQFDATSRTGWSVLARGKAHFDYTYGRVDAPGIDVWPSGVRRLRLDLDVTDISGRRLVS